MASQVIDEVSFFNAVRSYDRYYSYSDDLSVWKAGKAREEELYECSKISPKYKAIWDAWHAYFADKTGKVAEPKLSDFGLVDNTKVPPAPTGINHPLFPQSVRRCTDAEVETWCKVNQQELARASDWLKKCKPATFNEVEFFLDNRVYDPNITRGLMSPEKDISIFLPASGNKGNCYLGNLNQSKAFSVFNSPNRLKMYILKYVL